MKKQFHQESDLGSVDILGVPVVRTTRAFAIRLLDAALSNGEQMLVAFANACSLNLAFENDEFCDSLRDFLILNDGVGVSLASRILYRSDFEENLNGTDFVPFFMENSQQPLRLFLLGGKPGVAQRAGVGPRWLSRNLSVVGCHDGFFDKIENDEMVRSINESGANVLLVALGNPLQELWIHRNRGSLRPTLLIGVGALFDFLAGEIPRAPRCMRVFKIEWAFRLFLEPKRMWRRYLLGNPLFLYRVFRQFFSRRRPPKGLPFPGRQKCE